MSKLWNSYHCLLFVKFSCSVVVGIFVCSAHWQAGLPSFCCQSVEQPYCSTITHNFPTSLLPILPWLNYLSLRARVHSCYLGHINRSDVDDENGVPWICWELYCTVQRRLRAQADLASMQYCTVLYCTVLYCTVLCIVLYCAVLYCTVYSTVLYCIVLCCIVERRRQHSGKSLTVDMQPSNATESGSASWTPSQTCGLSTPPPHLTSTGQQCCL